MKLVLLFIVLLATLYSASAQLAGIIGISNDPDCGLLCIIVGGQKISIQATPPL